MIVTETGRLYTGISTDLDRRFAEHCNLASSKGAKFFRTDRAVELVYKESLASRSEASKREAQIKKLSRQKKCQLIAMEYRPVNKGS